MNEPPGLSRSSVAIFGHITTTGLLRKYVSVLRTRTWLSDTDKYPSTWFVNVKSLSKNLCSTFSFIGYTQALLVMHLAAPTGVVDFYDDEIVTCTRTLLSHTDTFY